LSFLSLTSHNSSFYHRLYLRYTINPPTPAASVISLMRVAVDDADLRTGVISEVEGMFHHNSLTLLIRSDIAVQWQFRKQSNFSQ